jgi:hypothetical protein
MTYDLNAEGINGVNDQTIVTALDGFPSEFGIAVWNVDATAASSIDAIWGTTSRGAVGVRGRSTSDGVGVRGEVTSGTGDGVQGQGSGSFSGVAGFGGSGDDAGTGVFGLGGVKQVTGGFSSVGAAGVRGIGGGGPNTAPPNAVGVYGQGGSNSPGISGEAGAGRADGVTGRGSGTYSGVSGFGGSEDGAGLYGEGGGQHGPGVRGLGSQGPNRDGSGDGVTGQGSGTNSGVSGFGGNGDKHGLNGGAGLYGQGGGGKPGAGPGVRGLGALSTGDGVQGFGGGAGTAGVRGISRENNGNGVIGEANIGPRAYAIWGQSRSGFAGYFDGTVQVNGDLNVTGSVTKGGGGFQIDHPLEPESKYLVHSFVESPHRKNIYDGVAAADPSGEAIVELPAYFDALNKEFRYQLTPIGAPAPTLHVKEELVGNRFSIGGAGPGQRVCWQITGTRKDAWALANPLVVEPDKLRSKRARLQPVDGALASS